MSRKPEPKVDRRVRRTRDALGDALMALIQEKSFETITVQHVLDRAGVGRSTFYAHFSDKDDLFLSDIEDFFEVMSTLLARHKEASNRVAPVRELIAHISEMRQLHAALVAPTRSTIFSRWGKDTSRAPSSCVSQRFRLHPRLLLGNAPPWRKPLPGLYCL